MDPSCGSHAAKASMPAQPDVYNPQELVSRNLEEIQDMIERVQRIQLLQEQRIVELERQLESHCESKTEFPSFARLPPELRCQIWRLALPSQIFRPFRFLQPSFLEWKSLPPPAISRVCREARYVAHQHGALYCHEFLAPIAWTWFNGHRDILDLSPYYMADNGFIPLQARLLEETRTILLDAGLVDSPLIAGLFGKGGHLGNVHTIYVMAGNTFQVDKQSWHPHAVARLFGDQSFALADIEDHRDLERLDQILETTGGADGSFMSKWHRDSIARLRVQVRPPAADMKSWKNAKRLLMQGWVSHKEGTPLPSQDSLEEGNLVDEGEMRKTYPQMPVVKLVQTFELAPVSRLAKWYREEGRETIEDARG
ncbi:hypothetical protein TARUN_8491 [Trichoderma arundinaceum]|uniref:2EXR domain-containing protein n=1 Tax=Trichoderma arundinaceum TaxID=490622 RepID=A0A395NCD1_TRIAR|nr:hypothetical protein TARUN_8491 [Trichoderma arundinaceum]